MLLSVEIFEAVVGTLNPIRATETRNVAGGGHRLSPRVPLATRLTIYPFLDEARGFGGYDFPSDANGTVQLPLADPVSAPVRDLSRGGLRFMMPRRLPLDTPFLVALPPLALRSAPSLVNAQTLVSSSSSTSAARPVFVEGAVTYWQPVQRDLFAIGARFIRVFDTVRLPNASPTMLLPGFGSPEFGRAAAVSAQAA